MRFKLPFRRRGSLARRISSLSLVLAVLVSGVIAAPTQAADATCPSNDLNSVFSDEFYPWLKWDNSSGNRLITWSTNTTSIEGIPVTRAFTAEELVWLREAVQSWDDALSTISFKEVLATDAEIMIGLTPIQNSGYWKLTPVNGMRTRGTIQISTVTDFDKTRTGFIEVAQSELGNLLGLGDITTSSSYYRDNVDSVMKDPDTAPFGSIPLADFDIDLMRQFYGESTCHADWPQALKDAKAKAASQVNANAEAEAKAKADAEANAKAEEAAKAKAQADLIAKLTAKKTILCAKGKTIKKVSAVKPVCPKGYKKIG